MIINKKSPFSISLIIPFFNEKENLIKVVRSSNNILRSMFDKYEIILIDDGGYDGNNAILKEIKKNYPFIKIINNVINLGQGTSILIGFQQARYELITHNGIDNPFDLNDLKKILPYFPKFDIVVATRDKNSGYTLWRKFVSLANNLLRRVFLRVPFKDLNFIQVYKKAVIENVVIKSRSPGFVTQELVIRAYRQGFTIKELKLPYYPRQKNVSHHGKLRDILWSFIDMLIFSVEKKYEKK